MAASGSFLTTKEQHRFAKCPVACPRIKVRITSLADYFAVISSSITGADLFWFRGHADCDWSLTPSALRFTNRADRAKALEVMRDFKRIADMKLPRPPALDQELMWAQLAQHYGLPTRLLDWSESAIAALYFAVQDRLKDGIVFVLNPVDLNRLTIASDPRVLDPQQDKARISDYFSAGVDARKSGAFPVALNPMWNSDRLIQQKGVFTLHGRRFSMDDGHVSSLVGIPILAEFKTSLRSELQRVGVDEMTLFPELEHACAHLKRKYGLTPED